VSKKMQAFRRSWEFLRPFKKHFVVTLAMLAVYELLSLLGPYFIGQVLNTIQEGESFNQALILIGAAFGVTMISFGLGCARDQYEIRYVDFALSNYLTSKTMEKVLGLSIGQHRSQNSGITHSVISKGENALKQMIFLLLYSVLPITLTAVLTCVLLVWFNPTIGLVVSGGIIIYVMASLSANRRYYPEVKNFSELTHRTNKYYTEIVRNPTMIQIQSQEERVQEEHDKRLKLKLSESARVWAPYSMRMWVNYSLTAVIRYSALTIGAILIFNEGYRFGDFLIIWAWTNQATNNIGMVARVQRQWLEHWSEAKKFFALLDVEPAVQMAANPIRPGHYRGHIEFRDVKFVYNETPYIEDEDEKPRQKSKATEPALRGVDFSILPGEKVAFVGTSGAGKSTIVNLLIYGWAPTNGDVLIDGHNLRDLDFKEFRSAIGVVEQKIALFDNTLRYNLLFGLNGKAEEITDEELDRIGRLTRIDQFWPRLKDGWDTRIGENGVRLSGGECQRVALARALIKQPSVLILDEATSSLDSENESEIKKAIDAAATGRTTIIIAHRLSTVRNADKIFVMDKGIIIAEGRHDELYESSPIYRNLVTKQLFQL